MEHINLDFDRENRLGFPEVVYGAGKSVEVIVEILRKHRDAGRNALITHLQETKSATLLRDFPNAFYDAISGVFMLRVNDLAAAEIHVGILSGGTSDQYVINEALHTLNFMGFGASLFGDIGVAGIQRLMTRLDELKRFKVLIVAAGFEGALPSVVGGLLPQPIIAVPTSVGYGVGAGGRTALNAMLASCANGITVVNIDNGYGAAVGACRMLRQFGLKGAR